jgi:Ca2+-binding RTX toxin-like protein
VVPTAQLDGDGYHLGDGTGSVTSGVSSDGGFGAYVPHDSGNNYHLGEDWNGDNAALDFGRPVYAIADGIVEFAGGATDWLNVVIVRTILPSGDYGGSVTTLYGHLGDLSVNVGDIVYKGETVGTIGDYPPVGSIGDHLHLEIRAGTNPDALLPGFGYSPTPQPAGWLDPSDFINANRSTTTALPYNGATAGSDPISGTKGTDYIDGVTGNDTIRGGSGADVKWGGPGLDRFIFTAATDSSPSAPDIISDFLNGTDRIDLSAIDANTSPKAKGDQAFAFADQNANVVANSVSWFESGGNTIVQADVNGNTTADLTVVLTGINHNLTASDFIL